VNELQRGVRLSLGALATSLATLVCCVLPAVLVALGAGAAVVGLVTAVPQLVWLSEHKALVFAVAATMLVIAGISVWRARRAPCPADPVLAASCQRLRVITARVYVAAVLMVMAGAIAAFVLPRLAS
jgi:hypothetical protein